MHRLFVALLPPAPLATAWARHQQGVEGARWQRADQLHLTLAFVGEVDRHGGEALAEALAGLEAPVLALSTGPWGAFEARHGRISTLWAGIAGAGLDDLAARVRSACRRAGTPAESRRFVPHVTLARFGSGGAPAALVAPFLATAAPVLPWPATGFHLMESFPGRGGSHYESRLEIPLRESSAGPRPR
jgi:2'-5' RNA ligase